jgi:hypothetical protein
LLISHWWLDKCTRSSALLRKLLDNPDDTGDNYTQWQRSLVDFNITVALS